MIDTAADTFGGNENVRTEVRQFVADCLSRLARELNCAVLMCAHPSRNGMITDSGDGGSTAWSNTVRSRVYLKRKSTKKQEQADLRTLSRRKANYAPSTRDEMELEWQDGVFSPVKEPSPVEQLARDLEADEAFLTRLDALTAQGQITSSSPQSGNYAPKLMSEGFDDGYEVTREELRGAMIRLMRVKIKEEVDGPPSKQRRRLVRIEEEDE